MSAKRRKRLKTKHWIWNPAAKPLKAKNPKRPKIKRGSFYQTAEWKVLRYAVLVQRGARCECCGASPRDGAVMNVDHIVPVSKAWDRRLDATNLQILCGSCNWGKGASDQTDWREPDEDLRQMFDLDNLDRI